MVAFLGAIVTALITLILLIGQSAEAELKERNVKIFQKKSKLFEKFFNKLYKIINNLELSQNDYNVIISEYFKKLTLYLKEDTHKKIYKQLINLRDYIGKPIYDGFYAKEIRRNIFNIINILAKDLGLAGNINISNLENLDNNRLTIPFKDLLLDEVNKIFSNEKIFNEAFYGVMANGTFLVLDLNGKYTAGGGLHIGPFYNQTANEKFPAYNGLYFRFFKPVFNPMAELYAVNDGTNYNKNLIDFENSDKGLIDLQKPLEPQKFKSIDIDSNVNNTELPIIRFDDINTIKRYAGIYMDIAKAIADRAFFYYSNVRTKHGGLSIKQLFEEFESITNEQFSEYVMKTLTTSIDFSK